MPETPTTAELLHTLDELTQDLRREPALQGHIRYLRAQVAAGAALPTVFAPVIPGGLGQLVYSLRQRKPRITRRAIVERTGISRPTLVRWEGGTTDLRVADANNALLVLGYRLYVGPVQGVPLSE